MTTDFDNKDDYLVRRAWELLDPLHGIEVPPMTVTAAELRRRAEQRHHGPRVRWLWHQRALMTRRRLMTLVTATTALVVAAGVVAFTLTVAASPAVAAPAPLAMDTGDNPPSARDWLTATAAGLTTLDRGDDQPNTYVHLQRWAIDTTSPSLELLASDEQVWWRPDQAAVTAFTKLPPQPSGRQVAQWLLGPPSAQATEVAHYPPGGYSVLVERPSANVAELKRQLESQEPAINGPQATPRAVAAFAQFHQLNAGQRAAALLALADVEGIRWRGKTTDRAGRPGFAISVDSRPSLGGSVRDVLVYDLAGELLSHEQITLTPPSGLSVPRYTVTAYTLYLECERTFDFGP
jgi:hypothetical protein